VIDSSVGHGPAFSCLAPEGDRHELPCGTETYVAPPALRCPYANWPQAFRPRGIGARQIDLTVMTAGPLSDATWYRDSLGYTFTDYTLLDEAEVPVFSMLTNNEKSDDLGLIIDQSRRSRPPAPRVLLDRHSRRAAARGRHPHERRGGHRVRGRAATGGGSRITFTRASRVATGWR
jgi:hypothetical protein